MILFIDDEPHRLTEYDEALRETGFKVQWVADAEEGMKFFLENKPRIEAVILDIMMPPPAILGDGITDFGMRTGVKILARIREETEDIPVMVFTNLSPSRLNLPPYKLVELREKRETPPFVLPKLLSQLIAKAKESSLMTQDNQEDESAHVVFKGPVHAQQMYVGNHGLQKMQNSQWHSKEEVLSSFFEELRDLIAKREMAQAERQAALEALQSMETAFTSLEPDRTQVAGAVGCFAKLAPWTKAKFSELVTGAAGSMLGTGIIAGIKFAFGIP